MTEENTLENAIKNYIFEVSGVYVSVTDDIVEMGLIHSMDFILLINFLTQHTGINFLPEDLHKKNFCSVSTIVSFLNRRKEHPPW